MEMRSYICKGGIEFPPQFLIGLQGFGNIDVLKSQRLSPNDVLLPYSHSWRARCSGVIESQGSCGKLKELCQLLVLTRIMNAAVLNGISSKELLVGTILLQKILATKSGRCIKVADHLTPRSAQFKKSQAS